MIALIVLAVVAMLMSVPCLFVSNEHPLARRLDMLAKVGACLSVVVLGLGYLVAAQGGR